MLNIPSELVNRIFMYISSPTANIIKNYWNHRRLMNFYDMTQYHSSYIDELIAWEAYIRTY
jgi:hypothetical protein